jgi:hypothetical protein
MYATKRERERARERKRTRTRRKRQEKNNKKRFAHFLYSHLETKGNLKC